MEDFEKIIDELIEWYNRIPKHFEGSILGSMTTWPHEIGVYAYQLFMHVNGNDPILFPIVKDAEQYLIQTIGTLYGSRHGLFTSGGTESNILALLIAKRASRGKDNVVVAPSTVHASVDKACILMGSRLVKIPVSPTDPVDPDLMEKYVRDFNPYAIVVTAGTTEFGVVDRIKEVSEIALEYDVFLHVDGAFGGLIVPFLFKHGMLDETIYFHPGVSSVSVDLHKNGRAPIPSSLLFVRDEELLNHACFEMEYLPSGINCGLLGTRPGGSLIASWAVVKAIGLDGYEKQALSQQKIALHLYEELTKRPFVEAYKPILPIVVWRSRVLDYIELIKMLMKEKIFLYKSPSLKAVRAVIMPHVSESHVQTLIKALEKIHGWSGGM
ncbi:MAG: aminotransferase class V-fold PLP-dependent enzyme [Thermosphaera sp.]